MKKNILSLLSLILLLSSCDTALEKGSKVSESTSAAVWQQLHLKKDLDKQRIALEGFISLENFRQRGDENYCELVDDAGAHLTYLTIKRKMSNSLKIEIANEAEANNLHYIVVPQKVTFRKKA